MISPAFLSVVANAGGGIPDNAIVASDGDPLVTSGGEIFVTS